ncbi:MAG: hypothetical protein COY58_00125 [Gammaproteobacteria bacterium CG_4_10_14_0_8_um_filter_38_16]|nr:MAG: hypothetical protein COY58_00125 [Gammaproteobacteria bacterium CG_4_10_14_0_8_um_filter_38_16]PJA02797.1 MAG: hypothetical protein COX72_08390 [Gammaproteobacteria bacterium CG_4_10_14_0_2_um_filter_38_22]PJB10712.1 MAG: hypothetical protein CO120_03325 [Gammaproteobacteria bacterium CG_4_9_14_3_um_filter_38_9]
MLPLLWILAGVASRLTVHIPDVTPLASFCVFVPTAFSKSVSFFIIFSILILSDIGLYFLSGYPIFGLWTLFTYSGWLGVTFFGFLFAKNTALCRVFLLTFFASLVFWIWSNFGTWCATSIYPHTTQGLLMCYVAAIPFLKNSLLGSLAWTAVLITLLHFFYRKISHGATIYS